MLHSAHIHIPHMYDFSNWKDSIPWPLFIIKLLSSLWFAHIYMHLKCFTSFVYQFWICFRFICFLQLKPNVRVCNGVLIFACYWNAKNTFDKIIASGMLRCFLFFFGSQCLLTRQLTKSSPFLYLCSKKNGHHL